MRFWQVAPERPRRVTILNLTEPGQSDDPSLVPVTGDACDAVAVLERNGIPPADLVFSNAVLEHVGGHGNRERFARSVEQLAPGHWVRRPIDTFRWNRTGSFRACSHLVSARPRWRGTGRSPTSRHFPRRRPRCRSVDRAGEHGRDARLLPSFPNRSRKGCRSDRSRSSRSGAIAESVTPRPAGRPWFFAASALVHGPVTHCDGPPMPAWATCGSGDRASRVARPPPGSSYRPRRSTRWTAVGDPPSLCHPGPPLPQHPGGDGRALPARVSAENRTATGVSAGDGSRSRSRPPGSPARSSCRRSSRRSSPRSRPGGGHLVRQTRVHPPQGLGALDRGRQAAADRRRPGRGGPGCAPPGSPLALTRRGPLGRQPLPADGSPTCGIPGAKAGEARRGVPTLRDQASHAVEPARGRQTVGVSWSLEARGSEQASASGRSGRLSRRS